MGTEPFLFFLFYEEMEKFSKLVIKYDADGSY